MALSAVTATSKISAEKWREWRWYRISATSDNKNQHQFHIIGEREVHPATPLACQFFLFLCGFEGKKSKVDKVCDKAWEKYDPSADVEGGGPGAPKEVMVVSSTKNVEKLLFRQGLEYASLKSFKVVLNFDKNGRLDPKTSQIYFHELVAAEPSDDDSAYRPLDFKDKAAFLELSARCK